MSVLDRWANRAAGHPPPGPFRAGFWRSPLRGPWFTAVLSVVLLPGITLVFLTGLASYAAYNPNLAPGNDLTPDKGLLGSWLPGWPAGPSWLYWVNQGVHVSLGLVLIPIILAKLWSVLPKLFEWPPVRSVTQLVERASYDPVTRREGVQLLALLASFVVAAYAGIRLLTGSVVGTGVWFVGSAVVHDLVLFPLYAGIDAALVLLLRRRPELATVAGVRWLNYLRVPAVISGLLLLVWSPLILRVSDGAYHAASGLSAQPFLPRWLAVTAVLFAISAVTLVVRAAMVRSAPRVEP